MHEVTGYTPNFLTLGRETQAPLDIVLGPPKEETDRWNSHDNFVADQQERMRISHTPPPVRIYGVVPKAERRLMNCGFAEQEIKPGTWGWYYYPHRWTERSPKWSRNDVGPIVVTKVIPPTNVCIQKHRRSQPKIVHVNILKACKGITPCSWLGQS